jgi:hypothetical protein
MSHRDTVTAIVHAAIDELNASRPAGLRLAKTAQTPLTGSAGAVDSLELVVLLHTIETSVSEQLGVTVHLTDSPAVFDRGGPLTRLDLLIDHLATLVG